MSKLGPEMSKLDQNSISIYTMTTPTTLYQLLVGSIIITYSTVLVKLISLQNNVTTNHQTKTEKSFGTESSCTTIPSSPYRASH